MKLNLIFTPQALGTLKRRVLVAFAFQEPSGKPEGIWSFNSRTSRYLHSLWRTKFWTGERGETLLVGCQELSSAEWILLKGLGKRSAYSVGNLTEGLRETGNALQKLRITSFGIRIPVIEEFEEDYPEQVDQACVELMESYFPAHRDDPDFSLAVAVSIDDMYIRSMRSRVSLIKKKFDRDSECIIEWDGTERLPE